MQRESTSGAILEGLSAADELEEDNVQANYLLFRLAHELYGAPLLSVREVLKLTAIKPVPYMATHFKGVINLRGRIVGVLDLRLKFELPVSEASAGRILIVEQGGELLGAIVDEVEAVEEFRPENIDTNPVVETKIGAKFFLGIGK